MNDRMIELLAQARNQPVDVVKAAPYGSAMLTPAQLATYTNLVVQECAKITKEHFGVEE
jgi:hypothetical protein